MLSVAVPPLMSALHDAAARFREVATNASGCGICLLTNDGRRITSVATSEVAERVNAMHDLYPKNAYATAWFTGEPVWMDVADRQPWKDEVAGLGVGSMVALPFAASTHRLGVLMIYWTEGVIPSAKQEALAVFASRIAEDVEGHRHRSAA